MSHSVCWVALIPLAVGGIPVQLSLDACSYSYIGIAMIFPLMPVDQDLDKKLNISAQVVLFPGSGTLAAATLGAMGRWACWVWLG